MTKTPDVFLHHILESIALIEKRMENITYEQFTDDIVWNTITNDLPPFKIQVQKLLAEFKE